MWEGSAIIGRPYPDRPRRRDAPQRLTRTGGSQYGRAAAVKWPNFFRLFGFYLCINAPPLPRFRGM